MKVVLSAFFFVMYLFYPYVNNELCTISNFCGIVEIELLDKLLQSIEQNITNVEEVSHLPESPGFETPVD